MTIDDNRLLENEISELKRIIFFNCGLNTLLSLFSLLTTFENELRELKRIIDDNWWQQTFWKRNKRIEANDFL